MYIRISQSLLPLAALLAVFSNATPIPLGSSIVARDYLYSLDTRDGGLASLDARDNDFSYLDARDEYLEARDALELRDEYLSWLVARSPGPGMKDKQESSPPVTTFKPVHANTIHTTDQNVYTGTQVNNAGSDLMKKIAAADAWNKKGPKTYPKPGTGFRNNEKENPAPKAPGTVAYHDPIKPPTRAWTLPLGGPHAGPGPDRLVAFRKAGEKAHTIGVSYHDPKKPIPAPSGSGAPSRNHPFTMASQKPGGPVKASIAKAGKMVMNVLKLGKKGH